LEGTKKVRVYYFPITNGYKGHQAVVKFNGFIAFADKMAPLGNASFRLCKLYGRYVFRFDKNGYASKSLHDGGFSNMGVSQEVMEMFE
jgi:enoyl-[acyl-carrier protein] reductase I